MYIQELYSEDNSDFTLLESLFESLSEVSSLNLLRANNSYDIIVENYNVLSGILMDPSKNIMISEAEEQRLKIAAERFVEEAGELEEQMHSNKANIKSAVKVATIAAILAIGFRLLVTKKLGAIEHKVLARVISIVMGLITGAAVGKAGALAGYLRLGSVYRNRLTSIKSKYSDDPVMTKKIDDAISKIDAQLKKKDSKTSESFEMDLECDEYSIVNENIDMINTYIMSESASIMLNEDEKEKSKNALNKYLMDTNNFIEHWKKSNDKGILVNKAMVIINLGMSIIGIVMWLYPPARLLGTIMTIVGYVTGFIGSQKSTEVKAELARLNGVKSKLLALRSKCKNDSDKEKIDLIIHKIDGVHATASSVPAQ